MSQCQRCSAKCQLFLCPPCETELRDMLLGLPRFIDYLIDAALGQTRLGESARRSSDTTTPLLCNESASRHLDNIHAMLVRWVQDLCETRGVDYPGPRMVPRDFIGPLLEGAVRGHAKHTKSAAVWLASHTSAIACDEAAGQCFDDIRNAIVLIESVINRPLPSRFLGPCPALLNDNYGERICNVELTACRDDSYVQCGACKTTHRVDDLHDQQMKTTGAMSFTLSELYRMILPVNQEYVPLRTLQHWVSRGRLVPTGYDAEGEPRFLLDDVRELRRRTPQAAATGAAAHKRPA
jgi:hypothetical protein